MFSEGRFSIILKTESFCVFLLLLHLSRLLFHHQGAALDFDNGGGDGPSAAMVV